ncbi:DUF2180 family protein [Actinacidiphila epipremni]|jgi:hypothetical protein|uniref:DUF2180 family protein n=1 Tax=Actinacidiphila epipremni TaxID=2053013 RepID=A0ABX0ZS49_9ACTN|nr:DUF2180 family protein [Actinacidiphila epipremni]NJP45812.1 DUF2180 family protein [Actinacidiphila epipremni]
MNCYECDAQGHSTPAVAVCRTCGAATCAAHGQSSPLLLDRANGLGVATLRRPARQIHCATCASARTAG